MQVSDAAMTAGAEGLIEGGESARGDGGAVLERYH